MEAKKRKAADHVKKKKKKNEKRDKQTIEEIDKENPQETGTDLLKEIKSLKTMLKEKDDEIEELRYKNASLINRFNSNKIALEREKEQTIFKAKEDLLLNLIVLLQNFERALNHMSGMENNVIVGIRMIYKQMKNLLNEEGLAEIIPDTGEPFDPFTTEVSETRETEEFGDMCIIEVVENGFSLKGKILKPAKVIVAMKPHEVEETGDLNEAD